VRIAEELRDAESHSPRSRRYVDEIMTVVGMMRGNFTVANYELALGKLNQMRELRALVSEEEKSYTQAKEHIDSVREEILSSQRFLGKWQSTLLSHAYESLAQGNYSSAVELAKQSRDLPGEIPREEPDPALSIMLWRASLAMVGFAVSSTIAQSLRTPKR
jgi:hypothetical protein